MIQVYLTEKFVKAPNNPLCGRDLTKMRNSDIKTKSLFYKDKAGKTRWLKNTAANFSKITGNSNNTLIL